MQLCSFSVFLLSYRRNQRVKSKLLLGRIDNNSVAAGGLWNGVGIDLSFFYEKS
jgi:hypothetical protein